MEMFFFWKKAHLTCLDTEAWVAKCWDMSGVTPWVRGTRGQVCYRNSHCREESKQMNVWMFLLQSLNSKSWLIRIRWRKVQVFISLLSFHFSSFDWTQFITTLHTQDCRTAGLQDSLEMFFIYLIDSSCQLSTSLSDIFFLKIPFFWMLRLLAAKFSKSVRVPAERVEWILADTDNVEPVKCLFGFIVFQRGPECRTNF